MLRVTARTLAAAAAVLAVVLASSSPAAAISTNTYEKQVHVAVNKQRDKRDLVKLKGWRCTEYFAEKHARWMAANQRLKHQDLGHILKRCNLTGVAENIAYGYATGNKATSAWMRSPGHRRNILAKKMRYTGVGAVQDSSGRWWVAQVFGTRK